MGPSDSLSTQRDFAVGLYPPPSPNVGRRGGSPQFRIRLYLRAVFPTPEASCASPVPQRSLLPSPRHDWLGHFPFRVPISRGCKVHALAFGPQVCSPRAQPYSYGRALDAPLGRHPLGRQLEPATRRSGAYRGGTYTRKSDAASRPDGPDPASFRTHHGGHRKPLGIRLAPLESVVMRSRRRGSGRRSGRASGRKHGGSGLASAGE
jgi:hypothetical protein